MGYIRQIYIAGQTIIVREKMKRNVEQGKKRSPKKQITSDKVWWYNLKQATFKLTLALNNNFGPGDHHLQLTYKQEPESRETAAKDRKEFLRRVTADCRKEGIEFKWVGVTAREGKRLHHHIVCSNIPMRIINKHWPKNEKGIVFHNPLWDNPNYSRLAEYLLKEAAALYMEEGLISKKRYTTSRNIIMPKGKEEDISRKNIEDEPEAFKDYEIDEDSVQVFENELIDSICREYIMISTKETPRLKYWSKGVMVTGEYVNYSKALREAYSEYQESFWEEI